MKNINNKSIALGLKILSVMAFSLMMVPTSQVFADYGTNFTFGTPQGPGTYPNYNGNAYGSNYNSYPYQAPVYNAPAAPAPTPVVYSNDVSNTTPAPAAASASAAKPVAKVKTTSPAVAYNYIAIPAGAKIVKSLPAGATVTDPNTVSGLTANAFFGSNSFMPSGLIQWIILAIFILLMIILGRIIFGSKKSYMEAPLKHQ